MYFYVDESGQTGINLFDLQQPVLYYGVLSSPHDMDEAARATISQFGSALMSQDFIRMS